MSVRSWAHYAIQFLQSGLETKITPHGESMSGRVEDGDEVIIAPVPLPSISCPECEGGRFHDDEKPCETCDDICLVPQELKVDDIVLCRVKGKDYLHLIKAIQGDRYQIGNNRGGINGWINEKAIYGVATQVAGVVVKKVVKEESESSE